MPLDDAPCRIDPATPVDGRERLIESLVHEDSRDPLVCRVARSLVQDHRSSPRDALQALLDGMWTPVADGGLGLVYAHDPPGEDVYQHARRTIAMGKGDCKKLSIVFAAMARAVGLNAWAVWIDQPEADENHVAGLACVPKSRARDGAGRLGPAPADARSARDFAVLVHTPGTIECPGGQVEWVETTIRGARVGEHPYDVLARALAGRRATGGMSAVVRAGDQRSLVAGALPASPFPASNELMVDPLPPNFIDAAPPPANPFAIASLVMGEDVSTVAGVEAALGMPFRDLFDRQKTAMLYAPDLARMASMGIAKAKITIPSKTVKGAGDALVPALSPKEPAKTVKAEKALPAPSKRYAPPSERALTEAPGTSGQYWLREIGQRFDVTCEYWGRASLAERRALVNALLRAPHASSPDSLTPPPSAGDTSSGGSSDGRRSPRSTPPPASGLVFEPKGKLSQTDAIVQAIDAECRARAAEELPRLVLPVQQFLDGVYGPGNQNNTATCRLWLGWTEADRRATVLSRPAVMPLRIQALLSPTQQGTETYYLWDDQPDEVHAWVDAFAADVTRHCTELVYPPGAEELRAMGIGCAEWTRMSRAERISILCQRIGGFANCAAGRDDGLRTADDPAIGEAIARIDAYCQRPGTGCGGFGEAPCPDRGQWNTATAAQVGRELRRDARARNPSRCWAFLNLLRDQQIAAVQEERRDDLPQPPVRTSTSSAFDDYYRTQERAYSLAYQTTLLEFCEEEYEDCEPISSVRGFNEFVAMRTFVMGRETTHPSRVAWVRIAEYAPRQPYVLDPLQGCVGDCYFISSLAAVAWTRPDILERGGQRGAAVYDAARHMRDFVFYNPGDLDDSRRRGEPMPVRVSERTPAMIELSYLRPFAKSFDPSVAWPMVYEKAFAELVSHERDGRPAIPHIDGRVIGWHEQYPGGCFRITGGSYFAYLNILHVLTSGLIGSLYELVRAHSDRTGKAVHPMYVGTCSGTIIDRSDEDEVTAAGLVPNHAYSVLGADVIGGVPCVVLRNPWGLYVPPHNPGDGTRWQGLLLGEHGVFALPAALANTLLRGLVGSVPP